MSNDTQQTMVNDRSGHVLARFAGAERDQSVVVRQISYLLPGENVWRFGGWSVCIESDAAQVIHSTFPAGPAHSALAEAEKVARGLRYDATH